MSDARETHGEIPRGRGGLPLLFATASFPCRGSLIIRLAAEQGKQRGETSGGREREREMNGEKGQRAGWEFFSEPLHRAVKNTPRVGPHGPVHDAIQNV